MSYWYYPGCSAKSNGRAYEESLRAVFKALDVTLEDLQDWNCCGATAYMSVDEVQAFTLAARNLALTERQGGIPEGGPPQLMAPCSACYLVLSKTQRYIQQHPDLGRQVNAALQAVDLSYSGKVQIRHPLDVLVNDVGLERVSRRVKQPL
ncbi:MAG TPA: heterodisulfide reductase-related iron-sulfur binding cluster, partial [Candidatus Acidoferrum sp.]|nr:heterodisulfide reductase-related iron-sulfur binding cluster [Candidatus Acidoferrum sp.]